MQRHSKARIIVDRSDETRADGHKKVEIVGTTTEIENAKVRHRVRLIVIVLLDVVKYSLIDKTIANRLKRNNVGTTTD